MVVSVFDIFSIGVGPSSSHTVGPMRAANRFLKEAKTKGYFEQISSLKINLYGSLAMTGKGHLTDQAILLGLQGHLPESIDPSKIEGIIASIQEDKNISLLSDKKISFDPEKDLLFVKEKSLPLHPNAFQICAYDSNNKKIGFNSYYSIGGGFVLDHKQATNPTDLKETNVRHPFKTAKELLYFCKREKKKIYQIMLENETAYKPEANIRKNLLHI